MLKDYSYEYEYDSRYCYPESRVLKNKLNITDEKELLEAEREIISVRMAEILGGRWTRGKFDFAHLKQVHKFLFGDIYDWAGKVRLVNISKGNRFCKVEFIEKQMNEIFQRLKCENFLRDVKDTQELGERLAYYLGEINAIHPFREGNGRAQRLFIEHLAHFLGYRLDFMKINREDMLLASVKAFDCDYTMLEELIIEALEKEM
ncbi:Fic/DOC family protein [Faecalicatena contorta]|uniref:protein adenylyltransferase n=1 Tax=Faecalicatena contorta TaxID=39482 RepID=A0A316ADP4_9FIRM|nr:Fic family protein [Faecalicatena contorta]PWJ47897.1 cell filamentation protein [Faecalicatena contorta]SUQ15660.1 cell filamentation protein [Faecalicatena contorta]